MKTEITKDTGVAAAEIIKGNVIGLPSETVYGLGANALDENAVLKIFETKERPRFNPIIVHIDNENDLEKYADVVPDKVYDLVKVFSPGPITYILKKKNIVPDIVTAGNDNVGLRIPSHPLLREVLKKTGLPIAAPSANRFGKISPTSAEDVLNELEGKIKYILDGGRSYIGIESTVISFINDEVKILRPGFITKEEIEKIIGEVSEKTDNEAIISPGQLKSHYAPRTPLYQTDDIETLKENSNKNIGVLDLQKYKDEKEIALNLFSDLRKLDSENFDIIVYKEVANKGLGFAINDRLWRASSGTMNKEQ